MEARRGPEAGKGTQQTGERSAAGGAMVPAFVFVCVCCRLAAARVGVVCSPAATGGCEAEDWATGSSGRRASVQRRQLGGGAGAVSSRAGHPRGYGGGELDGSGADQ